MFCTRCGNELEQYARFCSKCGQDVATSTAVASPPQLKKIDHDMNMHVNILGWLLVASSILTAIGGMIALFASQFIARVPMPIHNQMPPGVPPFFGWVMSMIGLAALVMAAATAAAGVGLLQYRSWARTFAVIMAVFLVFHFPIGTAVAVYAFWVLFSKEGQQYYKLRSEGAMTPRGT